MFLGGFNVPDCPDKVICEPGLEFVLQISRQTKVHQVQLDVIVLYLVDDIEVGKVSSEIRVASVGLVCGKHAACIKRVAERINVEIPVVRTTHRASNAANCSGCLLLPYRSLDLKARGDFICKVICVSQVYRITANLIRDRPALVVIEAGRKVRLRFIASM